MNRRSPILAAAVVAVATVTIAAATVSGCGSARPGPTGTGTGTGTGAGAGGEVSPELDLPPLAEGCPATWAEAVAGATCERGSCRYPEGDCGCGVPQVCSGAEMDPSLIEAVPPTWQCRARPPAIRADGCPGVAPSGACDHDGQACGYGDCCTVQVTCQGGQWVSSPPMCPP
ncbi:MAG: hypothetical protein H6709_10960 [Kofleriaceae bacterium]|nr:hypothetical protein [Kofleriaceae bacterium]